MFVAPASAQPAHELAETQPITEVPADVHVEPGFPPFDTSTYPSQLLWLAITFGIFYLFLKRVALPRIGGILEVRRDRIAQDLDHAARMKEEADAAVAAYEQELAEARTRAGQIGQSARDEAKAAAEVQRKRIEADLDAKLSTAEARISEIRDSAMRDIGTIAEETATAIVQELGGGRVDQASIAAAVKAARE